MTKGQSKTITINVVWVNFFKVSNKNTQHLKELGAVTHTCNPSTLGV